MRAIKLNKWSELPDKYTGIVEYSNGTKYWYLNSKPHRENGPAIEDINGYRAWYLNGTLHRKNGPAIEWSNKRKSWYLNGNKYTEDEYRTEMMIRNCTLGKLIFNKTDYNLEKI